MCGLFLSLHYRRYVTQHPRDDGYQHHAEHDTEDSVEESGHGPFHETGCFTCACGDGDGQVMNLVVEIRRSKYLHSMKDDRAAHPKHGGRADDGQGFEQLWHGFDQAASETA